MAHWVTICGGKEDLPVFADTASVLQYLYALSSIQGLSLLEKYRTKGTEVGGRSKFTTGIIYSPVFFFFS